MKPLWCLLLSVALLQVGGPVAADAPGNIPNLLGVWTGKFTRITPEGSASGVTFYEITEQTGSLLKGQNRWTVHEGTRLDGDEKASNAFFGVVAEDGTIYFVSEGDTAIRRIHMTDPDTMDFVEFAGGENMIVVRARLHRNGSAE